MGKVVKSLVAIVAGAAVVLIPAAPLSRSYGASLQPITSGNYGTAAEIKKYVPLPTQKKKEEQTQTAYFNLEGAFGRPTFKLERLIESYIA